MNIKLKLPKWATEHGQTIYVFAGRELLAYKEPKKQSKFKPLVYKSLMLKKTRCNKCGKCCMNVTDKWPLGVDENGDCTYLGYVNGEYLCFFPGVAIPFTCCRGWGSPEECVINFEAVE